MAGWRRVAHSRLLDVGMMLVGLVGAIRIAWVLPQRANRNDFAHYYLSSRLLLEGKNPYSTPLEPLYAKYGFVLDGALTEVRTPNPPAFLWLFAPLAVLGPRGAFAVWVTVEILSLSGILFLTQHCLADRLSNRGMRFVCAAGVASAPVYWHFYFSQVQLLLAATVLAAYAWQRQGRHLAACLAVVGAGLVKLFPFVLLPWFLWHSGDNARTRIQRTAAALSVVVVVLVVTRLALWMDYLRYAAPVSVACAADYTFNFNLPSFLVDLGYSAYGFKPPPAVARVWWAAGSIVGLGLIVLAYLLCLRVSNDREAQFCLLCAVMLGVTITARGHYYVFLIFPAAVAAVHVATSPSGLGIIFLGLCLLLLNEQGTWAGPFLDRHLYLKVACNNLPLYGLVALGLFFGRELVVSSDSRGRL